MTLKVIGAGLGRTGTLSLKLALEHIGFARCYHMSEALSQFRAHLPLWIESAKGNPRWDTIFAGYQSSTDYPGCMFWRQLVAKYPDARIILTTRDPDKWFDSVTATVFSDHHRARLEGDPLMAEFFDLTIFDDLGDRQPAFQQCVCKGDGIRNAFDGDHRDDAEAGNKIDGIGHVGLLPADYGTQA